MHCWCVYQARYTLHGRCCTWHHSNFLAGKFSGDFWAFAHKYKGFLSWDCLQRWEGNWGKASWAPFHFWIVCCLQGHTWRAIVPCWTICWWGTGGMRFAWGCMWSGFAKHGDWKNGSISRGGRICNQCFDCVIGDDQVHDVEALIILGGSADIQMDLKEI